MPLISDERTRLIPRLHELEAREVPAAQIFVTDHVLHILGDGHANNIVVRDNGAGTISVTVGGEHVTVSGIHEITIATGGGADHVDYKMTGALKTTEDIKVWLGKGADQAHFNFADGVAAGGHLKLTVDGGPGADRETATIGSIAKGGSAVLDMNGGKGRDTLDLHASGMDAGRLSLTAHGGPGHDTEDIIVTDRVTSTGYLTLTTN